MPQFAQAARQPNTLRWRWHYRTPKSGAGPSIRARGMFVTERKPNESSYFRILAIKGNRNGDKITGLYPAGTSIPGNDPYTGDNLIRKSNAAREPQLNTSGFQYALKSGDFSNVFYANFLTPSTYLDFHSVPPYPQGTVYPNNETPVIFKAHII